MENVEKLLSDVVPADRVLEAEVELVFFRHLLVTKRLAFPIMGGRLLTFLTVLKISVFNR